MDERILEFDFEKYVSNLLSDEAKKQIASTTRAVIRNRNISNAPPTELDQKTLIRKKDEVYNTYKPKIQDGVSLHSVYHEIEGILSRRNMQSIVGILLAGKYVFLHSTVGEIWGYVQVLNEILPKIKNHQFAGKLTSEILMELFSRSGYDSRNHNDLWLANLFSGITGLSLTNHRKDISRIRNRSVAERDEDSIYKNAIELIEEQINTGQKPRQPKN